MRTSTEFLNMQTKEQIIIFLHNSEDQVDSLRERLYKLTGCYDFGNVDGMNGSCVECYYDNRELFEKCWNFKFDKKEVEK